MTLHLPTPLTIEARNAHHPYIGSMTLNGTNYDRNYLEHKDLMKGGTIVFQMQEAPNHQRGITAEAAPYSLTKELETK